MELRILSDQEYKRPALKIYHQCKKSFNSFNGFDFFNKKVILGQTSYLKNKTKRTHFAGTQNGQIKILVTLFQSLDKQHSYLGNFLNACADNGQVEAFMTLLQSQVGVGAVFPINGHPNLGFTFPENVFQNGSFLTSSGNLSNSAFFRNSNVKQNRQYLAYTVKADENLRTKTRAELDRMPSQFSVRNISRLHLKRDIRIYNHLVNATMVNQENFIPLSFEEEWELFKNSFLVLEPKYFKFLLFEGREIGFCFGIPNYNEIFKNGEDLKNIWRLLTGRQKIKSARIIYSGILPEWRGRKLFKYVRHQVIMSMIENGIEEIESSYIDQDNISSQENVKSTGGVLKNRFYLYRFKGDTNVPAQSV